MNHSKVAITVSKTVSVIQMLAGIFLVFLFSLMIIILMTDKELWALSGESVLIFCLVVDALGILLIVLSIRKSKLIGAFKKYVEVVSSDPTGYIPDIAASLGSSENVVERNLKLMVEKKYFTNAFIDLNTNCIVVANRRNTTVNPTPQSQADTPQASNMSASVSHSAVEMVTVKCKGCGGINTIQKGAVGECDYCGSSIKGE